MKKQLNEYLDCIHAGEALKEKTKIYVKHELYKQTQSRTGREKKRSRRFTRAFVTAAACLVAVIGGAAVYSTPRDYISLDINPSVELGVNVFGRVVSAQGINEDGEGLLQNMQYWNQSVEQTVQMLVEQAAEQAYLADDGSSVIAVTAESEVTDRALSLQSQGEQGAGNALEARNMAAAIYSDATGLTIRTQAQELGISPGKYRLILALQAMDPGISVDEYRNMKISEIMRKADELKKAGAMAGKYGDVLQKMEKAMDQVRLNDQAAQTQQEGLQTQTQARDQDQLQQHLQDGTQASTGASTGVNAEMEQNQNQVQASGAAQEQNQNGNMNGSQSQDQTQEQSQSASCTPTPTGNSSSAGQNQDSGTGGAESQGSGTGNGRN